MRWSQVGQAQLSTSKARRNSQAHGTHREGVIEGACRSLVRDRMDITGARWGLEGGEAVLKLRSLRASGDLDDYLRFHSGRELERNHIDRFDDSEFLELRGAA